MNTNLAKELEARTKGLDEKDRKKLKIDVLQRLVNKLDADEHSEIEQDLTSLIQQVPDSPIDSATRKSFRTSLKKIQKKVKEAFGYIEKGKLKGAPVGIGTGIGIGIGAAIGKALMDNQDVGVGIGIILGVVIASFIGATKEKKAEKAGLLY